MASPIYHLGTPTKGLPTDTTAIDSIPSANNDCNHDHHAAGPSQTLLRKASSVEACVGGEMEVSGHEDVGQAETAATNNSCGGHYEPGRGPLNSPGGERQQGGFFITSTIGVVVYYSYSPSQELCCHAATAASPS
jgi:hypothetical protein